MSGKCFISNKIGAMENHFNINFLIGFSFVCSNAFAILDCQCHLIRCRYSSDDLLKFVASSIFFGRYQVQPWGDVSVRKSGIELVIQDPVRPNESKTLIITSTQMYKVIFYCGEKTTFFLFILKKIADEIRSTFQMNDTDTSGLLFYCFSIILLLTYFIQVLKDFHNILIELKLFFFWEK